MVSENLRTIAILIAIIGVLCGTVYAQEKRAVRILGRNGNEIVIEPYTPPVLYVKQTAGKSLPEKGAVICSWEKDVVNSQPVIIGSCENGVRLEITGLDLNY